MKAAVSAAIDEITAAFPDATVSHKDDGDGGAHVLIDPVEVGAAFTPSTCWVSFHIPFTYPEVDIYPHFLDPKIQYNGKREAPNKNPEGDLPSAMTRGAQAPGFDRKAVQVSRQNRNVDPEVDTALYKLKRVLSFLRDR